MTSPAVQAIRHDALRARRLAAELRLLYRARKTVYLQQCEAALAELRELERQIAEAEAEAWAAEQDALAVAQAERIVA